MVGRREKKRGKGVRKREVEGWRKGREGGDHQKKQGVEREKKRVKRFFLFICFRVSCFASAFTFSRGG